MALHGRGQTAYTFPYLLGSGVGKIQAHMAGAFAAFIAVNIMGVEGIARDERHVLLDGGVEDGFHVEPLGQSYPEEQAAFGTGPGYFGREELFE